MNQNIEHFIAEELSVPDEAQGVTPATGAAPSAPSRGPLLALVPPPSPAAPTTPAAASTPPVPADQIAQPQPARIDPLVILDEIAQAVLEDPLLGWARGTPGKLTQGIAGMHAQALKFVLRAAPLRCATARQEFINAYAATALSGAAGSTFDAATPCDVPYMLIIAAMPFQSAAERKEAWEVCEGASTPAAAAMKYVFAKIAPGGLDDATFALACAIIRSDLVSVGGRLAYSEMDENATIDGREVEDKDVAALEERIDLAYSQCAKTAPLRAMTDRAVNKVAMERPYHVVRDYMNALPPWDGKPRLKYVVRDLLRAEDAAADLAKLTKPQRREVMKRIALARRQIKKFFVGGVARTMKPGCKHDSVLILKGKQGRQKSTWFRTITPCGRFSDADMDLQNKDSILELRKNFIFEWSELSTVRSAKDWEVVKGFTARQEDTVRPPYARRAMRRLRHCVIVGTTNEAQFLSDSTGSRRWWVIEVGNAKIDLSKTEEQRDQLWAEAIYLWRRGYRWWFGGKEDEFREKVNEQHSVQDPWVELIENWLAQGAYVTPSTMQILTVALQMDPAKQTYADSRHVGRVMRTLGYATGDCWDAGLKKSYKGWFKKAA